MMWKSLNVISIDSTEVGYFYDDGSSVNQTAYATLVHPSDQPSPDWLAQICLDLV